MPKFADFAQIFFAFATKSHRNFVFGQANVTNRIWALLPSEVRQNVVQHRAAVATTISLIKKNQKDNEKALKE